MNIPNKSHSHRPGGNSSNSHMSHGHVADASTDSLATSAPINIYRPQSSHHSGNIASGRRSSQNAHMMSSTTTAAATESDALFSAMLQSPSYSRNARYYQGLGGFSASVGREHLANAHMSAHTNASATSTNMNKNEKKNKQSGIGASTTKKASTTMAAGNVSTHLTTSTSNTTTTTTNSSSSASSTTNTNSSTNVTGMMNTTTGAKLRSGSGQPSVGLGLASPHVTIISPQSGTVTLLAGGSNPANANMTSSNSNVGSNSSGGGMHTSTSSNSNTSGRSEASTSGLGLGFVGGIPANIHPAIGRLGLQYARFQIMGGNARCIAMLRAFQTVISDYASPSHTALNRHLDGYLKPLINYLVGCRPLSTSMGNAIRHLKCEIANLSHELSEEKAKEQLIETIDAYIRDRIHLADRLIIQHASTKIQDGDVILIYAKSSVILDLLLAAHAAGKAFRVLVVDARPWLEGRASAERLSRAGLHVTYVLLNAIGYAVREATKILLGAHCVYSNGTVLARVGTCLVAMTGYDHRVPVIVCCETYKFSDRVQLESSCPHETAEPALMRAPAGCGPAAAVVYASGTSMTGIGHANANTNTVHANATLNTAIPSTTTTTTTTTNTTNTNAGLGSGSNLKRVMHHANAIHANANTGSSGGGGGGSSTSHVLSHPSHPSSPSHATHLPHLLTMMHDISPSKYIHMIITEIGMIPCTSVPVVLREYLSNSSGL